MENIISKDWHHLPADEVIDLLKSDQEKGLIAFEVEQRQKRFGPNVISGKKGRGPLARFLLQFHNPLIYVRLGTAAITALLQEYENRLHPFQNAETMN